MARPRAVMDRSMQPIVTGPGREVKRLTIEGKIYAQCYINCSKECSVCMQGGANFSVDRPGHGPYWYELKRVRGRLRRRYIGIHLVRQEVEQPEFENMIDGSTTSP